MWWIYWSEATPRGKPELPTGSVVVAAAIKVRASADIPQNERSSRSHSVFTIVIESKPRDGDGDDDVRLSRLTLIVSPSYEIAKDSD